MNPSLWRRRLIADPLVGLAVTVIVLGPVLFRPGYLLRGDMVFVPGQPWKGAWLGLDGGVPRSVPMDAVVWFLEQALPGDVVQRIFLAGSLLLLALGMARLLHTLSAPARWAGMVLACWNPYVYERFAIGQWACVLGLAVLPWLIGAAVRLRDAHRGGGRAVAGWMLLAGICAPSIGLTAVVVLACVLFTRPTRRALALGALAGLGANLPWIVPSLLCTGLVAPGPEFAGFAASSESAAGKVASVLSLGGIWKTSIIPPERTVVAVVIVGVALTAVALALVWVRRASVPWAGAVLAATVGSFLVATLPSWAPVTTLLQDLTTRVPAVGILRDSTRYLAPAVITVAAGFGFLVESVVKRAHTDRVWPAFALVLLPIAMLPSLAWGLGGFFAVSHYPSAWFAARSVMDRTTGGAGTAVVLPWHGSYRGFTWTGHHAVLDPAPRFFPGTVLIDDRMYLQSEVLGNEDPYLAGIGAALAAPDPDRALSELGVDWVILEPGAALTAAAFPDATVRVEDPDLTLLQLPARGHTHRDVPPRILVLVVDVIAISQFGVVFYRRRTVSRYRSLTSGGK